MMLLYLFIIGTIYTNQISAQIVHDAMIPIGKPYEMRSPEYPINMFGWTEAKSIEWNLKVENNGKIKIVCDDIRMVTNPESWEPDCTGTYVSTIDGNDQKKACGHYVENFIVVSKGPTIKFKAYGSTAGGVLFKCFAINMGEPKPSEIIYLEPMGHAKRIVINERMNEEYPNLDRLWKFESPPGTRLSVQCFTSLRNKKPICGKDVLIFNDGESDDEVCDYKEFLWFTKGNKGKLRLQFDHVGNGHMNCLVQAITGDKPNEYENMVFEEVDSSEHGVTAGPKQTSCKCGWSNKQGARIVSGSETKPNEYPWMIHMYVNHETSTGIRGTTCGASILTQRHVLTAAHCLDFSNKIIAKPENVRMEIGKHDERKPSGKEVIIHAERIFIGERYIEKDIAYDDIALIYTKETIDFSSLVGPICLESYPLPVINKQIKIMGWGLTEERSSSKYLREGKSTVVDWAVCDANAWDICTTSKPSGFCSGDSGGPLVWVNPNTNRYSQVSLVSRASGCRTLYMKSTNVTYYYDWIQEKIRETEPNMKTCHEI